MSLALPIAMHPPRCVVYILRSDQDPRRYYTGVTSDVVARIDAHNAGRCRHTSNSRPWRAVVEIRFASEQRALEFERYLKSGSGTAFAVRHFR